LQLLLYLRQAFGDVREFIEPWKIRLPTRMAKQFNGLARLTRGQLERPGHMW
jgi:hypothetical protein